MLTPQYILPLDNELIVDLFAGGGGASTGIEQALGRHVDIAINHDPEAIALHSTNHPQTRHFCSDVFEIDPMVATEGCPVGLLWASPDCKHFSKAKGGKPVSKKIRSLAWIVVKWAKAVMPRVILLENVEEFQTWGPLGKDQRPDPDKKGTTFLRWVNNLKNLGYVVEWRELRACDYGAPTIRKRLFLVARCDGQPISWPTPTHGDPNRPETKAKKLKAWMTAADCIDWSLPCPSIFERKKPLKEATLRRIAKGIMRYVVNAAEPYIVECNHTASYYDAFRGQQIDKPLKTITASPGYAIVVPHVTKFRANSVGNACAHQLHTVTAGGDSKRLSGAPHATGLVAAHLVKNNFGDKPGQKCEEPLHTITTQGNKFSLISAFLAKHYGGVVGQSVKKPTGTVTTADHHSLVTANIVNLRGTGSAHSADEPARTITAGGTHAGLVAALLVKYYGNEKDGVDITEPMHTVPTKDRFGLVSVSIHGESYVITDIGMRMLQPHELYKAQGFPEYYEFSHANGKPISKSAQVRMCGNSVCPPISAALVRANFVTNKDVRKEAA